jgi:hypothetical protein
LQRIAGLSLADELGEFLDRVNVRFPFASIARFADDALPVRARRLARAPPQVFLIGSYGRQRRNFRGQSEIGCPERARQYLYIS